MTVVLDVARTLRCYVRELTGEPSVKRHVFEVAPGLVQEDVHMPARVDPAVKERALRMLAEHRSDYPSDTALAEAVAKKVGVGRETARRWLIQADVNAGARPGVIEDDQGETKKLKAENRQLREDIEILKSATIFFAGELDPLHRSGPESTDR